MWLNDGAGRFTDATAARMPDIRVRFSWDLELADVDNDADLDVLVPCKRCPGSHLFRNDGAGTFTDDARGMPQYTNNYEFETMDLDGDGWLDLVTMNDGEIVGGDSSSRREHVFRNDGKSPSLATEWKRVIVEWTTPAGRREVPMQWYGENLCRAEWPASVDRAASYRVCATDTAGNTACGR